MRVVLLTLLLTACATVTEHVSLHTLITHAIYRDAQTETADVCNRANRALAVVSDIRYHLNDNKTSLQQLNTTLTSIAITHNIDTHAVRNIIAYIIKRDKNTETTLRTLANAIHSVATNISDKCYTAQQL